jgi:hypothetical protein
VSSRECREPCVWPLGNWRWRRACQEHLFKLQVKKIGREGAAQQIGQMFDAVF